MLVNRRQFVQSCLAVSLGPVVMSECGIAQTSAPKVTTGAEALVRDGFRQLDGKRVGLITNHTGRIGSERLIDVLARAPNVKLSAILTPEHGLAGTTEAGAKVGSGRDVVTGLPVFSLYGATSKPTPEMLGNLDVLAFDMQDIGVRYYTYISTMGLAMQAAAAANLPFVVLDRPNPLGGTNVSGFMREPEVSSFVGLFPIPQVHGLTTGELARMIKGQAMLRGLAKLQLEVLPCTGWRRDMLWPETGLEWVATSPNIPTFPIALAYAGTGLFEATAASEGRGTKEPFLLLGHPAIDVRRIAQAFETPGARIEATRFTPKSIAGVASNPRFAGIEIPGIRLTITDARAFEPVETAVRLLAVMDGQIRSRGSIGLIQKPDEFARLAGTRRLLDMIELGTPADKIIAAWAPDVAEYKRRRQPYLLY